jgi:hypothetical protein
MNDTCPTVVVLNCVRRKYDDGGRCVPTTQMVKQRWEEEEKMTKSMMKNILLLRTSRKLYENNNVLSISPNASHLYYVGLSV